MPLPRGIVLYYGICFQLVPASTGALLTPLCSIQQLRKAVEVFQGALSEWVMTNPLLRKIGAEVKVKLVRERTAELYVLEVLRRSQGRHYFDLGFGLYFEPCARLAQLGDPIPSLLSSQIRSTRCFERNISSSAVSILLPLGIF